MDKEKLDKAINKCFKQYGETLRLLGGGKMEDMTETKEMSDEGKRLDQERLSPTPEFMKFSKIPRYSRDCVITEKIDGTNAQIYITEDGQVLAGCRTRWVTPGKQTDNFGFAAWVAENKEELRRLGPGRHFGEWYGLGIQRKYDLEEKRFTLFRPPKKGEIPPCVHGIVPVLYEGPFATEAIESTLDNLTRIGSMLVGGFMKPEGIVIYHKASGQLFKKTVEGDEAPKEITREKT